MKTLLSVLRCKEALLRSTHVYPAVKQYCNELRGLMRIAATRYSATPTNIATSGYQLLVGALNVVDTQYIQQYDDPMYIYTQYLRDVGKPTSYMFLPIQKGIGYKNLFIEKGANKTTEYLCPCDDTYHLQQLPLLTTDPNEWNRIRPIMLHRHNSDGFTTHILNGKIKFKPNHTPTHAVYLVDYKALLIDYCVFYMNYKGSPKEYIYYKIIPGFLDDLVRIWMLRLIRLCVDDTLTATDTHTPVQLSTTPVGDLTYIGQRYDAAAKEIRAICELTKTSAPTILLSAELFVEKLSIASFVEQQLVRYEIPHLTQYNHIELLRDIELAILVASIFAINKTHVLSQKFFRNMLQFINILYNQKPWSKYQDQAFGQHLSLQMAHLRDIVQNCLL